MKKPLTNNIFCVTLAKYANIYVEAESPEEAMKIAEHWTDEVEVDDEEFENSEVGVDSCEAYSKEAYDIDSDTIYTQDEAIDVDDYIERYESQDPEEVARGGWDMTNQLELPLEEQE